MKETSALLSKQQDTCEGDTRNNGPPSITKTSPDEQCVLVLDMKENNNIKNNNNNNDNNSNSNSSNNAVHIDKGNKIKAQNKTDKGNDPTNSNNNNDNNNINNSKRKPRSQSDASSKKNEMKNEMDQAFSSMLAIVPNVCLDGGEEEAVLSDSMTQRNFHEKLHDGLHPNKYKKHKKKSKLTQMISGVSYKSKVDLFQKLFKDANSKEKLIIDYSCAFHRDILVHGRLYLSQNWLCFYANIFGWETLITVQWSDVTAITKEKTAKVIPNAIQILTDSEKYFFTTFVTRENAYTALFRIWQNALLGHPMQPDELKTICKKYRQKKSDPMDGDPINEYLDETGDEIAEEDLPSTNGSTEQLNRLETTGEMTSELPETNGSSLSNSYTNQYSPPSPASISEDKVQQTPSHEMNGNTPRQSGVKNDSPPPPPTNDDSISQHGGGEQKDEAIEKIKQVFKNGVSTRTFSKAQDLFSKKNKKKKKKKTHQRGHSIHLVVPPDDPGETTTDFDDEADSDASTDDRLVDEEVLCPCHDSHKGKEYANEEFNFDVDALYEHLFSAESDMMKRVFEERKHENWKYTPLEKDEEGCDTQTLTYTLNLNYSIGPKTSDTISKQVFSKDNKPGSFYIISTENRSVGVPYSDSFYVSVQYCITRCAGNRSRLKVHGELVYVKKVFGLVKNMISRNGEEAMRDYYVYLANLLRSESQLVPPTSSPSNIHQPKRKKLTKKLSKEQSKVIETTRRKSSHGSPSPSSSQTAATPQKQEPATKSNHSTKTFGSVLIIILLLFGMNLYLLRRLGALESSILLTNRKDWIPKELPVNEDEWKNLLQRQKHLHDLELIKLKEVVGNTAVLMKQVEASISDLYIELDKNTNRLSHGNPDVTDENTKRKEDL